MPRPPTETPLPFSERLRAYPPRQPRAFHRLLAMLFVDSGPRPARHPRSLADGLRQTAPPTGAGRSSLTPARLVSAIALLLCHRMHAAEPPEQAPIPVTPAPSCASFAPPTPYIPVDSWVYPAMLRLYALGSVDTPYLGMRPWTRDSLRRMLERSPLALGSTGPDASLPEAQRLYVALRREVLPPVDCPHWTRGKVTLESAYTLTRALSGTPLRDSFHLGSSVVNDYGRPFQHGFNSYTGAGGYATLGPFLLYARGEVQQAPAGMGYTSALAQALSANDSVPFLDPVTGQPYHQPTIPLGPVASVTTGRMLEAYVSTEFRHHVLSFGKQDDWLGPGLGGGMAYSNNADNIYSFRVNRIEPLHIPGLSRLTGPFRYEFLIGALQGHTDPNSPWVHLEKFSFRPTRNLEFGFERTVIWGGKGHAPITLHAFLRSFFSVTAPERQVKFSRQDPGARFSAFDFSYRLPGLRNWLTLYTDSEVHDDLSPISGIPHSGLRPGLYLARVPGVPRLDLRVEAVSTDPPVSSNQGGHFLYWETVQAQGYTNKGSVFGDWVGREAKGGQAWLTYHLSGDEYLQLNARAQKDSMQFLDGGTTLDNLELRAVKRLGREVELNAAVGYQQWKAPLYLPGPHKVTHATVQITWFPHPGSR